MSIGRVEFYMLGRRFEVACDAGQEGRLSALAQDLRRRMDELYASNPAVRGIQNEMQLLVMAALGYADLWQDTEVQRRQLAAQLERGGMAAPAGSSQAQDNSAFAELLEQLATELENQADGLEKLAAMA